MEWQKTSQCLAPCHPYLGPADLITRMTYTLLKSGTPGVLHFGTERMLCILPPVLSVKLWKGQMGSGGQFLHHLNDRIGAGRLQCTGNVGSETQNDRPRSQHKDRAVRAIGAVCFHPGNLIHCLFVFLYVFLCERGGILLASIIRFVLYCVRPCSRTRVSIPVNFVEQLPHWSKKGIQYFPPQWSHFGLSVFYIQTRMSAVEDRKENKKYNSCAR